MRRSPLVFTFTLVTLVAAGTLVAQGPPYGAVKTFAGDVTLEGKRVTEPGWAGRGKTTEDIRAVGPVRLTDNAMPDGAHMTWPMLSPTEMASNPAGMRQWRAQVTFSAIDTAPVANAHSTAQNISCVYQGPMVGTVALSAPPGGGIYALSAHVDKIKARCTGVDELGNKVNEEREFEVPAVSVQGTAPGSISGSKSVESDGWAFKLAYTLAAVR